MPRYESNTPEAARIASVKLDGRELLGTEDGYVRTADTDEGWVEVFETYLDDKGNRHCKMTEWRPVGKGRVREFVTKRLTGKVEVSFRPSTPWVTT